MSQLVWLASYPKSGSTWFRLMLAALRREEPFHINRISEHGGHAAARDAFEALTLLETGLLTQAEIDRLRPDVYRAIAAGEAPKAQLFDATTILKIHDAYLPGPDRRPLFGAASKAILIVRDPRDVAISMARAEGRSLDTCIEKMGDEAFALCAHCRRQHAQLPQHLGAWSSHVESWLGQADLPLHVVRYEDMARDPAGQLACALDFIGVRFDPGAVRLAAADTAFETLRAQEAANGFVEYAPPAPGGTFFRRGVSGGWRSELSAEQVSALELRHGATMRKLGYPLHQASGPATKCADSDRRPGA